MTVEVSLKGECFISSGIQESDLTQAIQNAFEGSELSPILDMEDSRKGESLHQRIDRDQTCQTWNLRRFKLRKSRCLLRTRCGPWHGERSYPDL